MPYYQQDISIYNVIIINLFISQKTHDVYFNLTLHSKPHKSVPRTQNKCVAFTIIHHKTWCKQTILRFHFTQFPTYVGTSPCFSWMIFHWTCVCRLSEVENYCCFDNRHYLTWLSSRTISRNASVIPSFHEVFFVVFRVFRFIDEMLEILHILLNWYEKLSR